MNTRVLNPLQLIVKIIKSKFYIQFGFMHAGQSMEWLHIFDPVITGLLSQEMLRTISL